MMSQSLFSRRYSNYKSNFRASFVPLGADAEAEASEAYGLTEETATSTDVWMKEELRSALKHYEIAKNETAKPTYGLTNGPMNG